MSKLVPGLVAVLLLVGVGLWAQSWLKDRDKQARDRADIAKAKQLVATNTWWMAELAKQRQQASKDSAESQQAEDKANIIQERRQHEPPAPRRGEVTDSALATFWQNRAEGYRQENGLLRSALESQKRAAAKLRLVADTATARAEALDSSLAKALKREDERGHFSLGLGIRLPKPPKWLAGTIGCLAAGTVAASVSSEKDRGSNALKACGAGGTAATILTPTD
jgi:hypothetical protein